MTPDEQARAAERRSRITAQVYSGFAEHDRADRAYWAAMPAARRVVEAWRLSEELWRAKGEFPDEPGLCRSVARLVRR